MVMSVVEDRSAKDRVPELAGARVLITGLESGHGVDIARAFAEQGCRLVLHSPALDTALDVLLETLVQDAEAVHVTEGAIGNEASAIRCAQSAVGVYGGLDAVVNLARLDDAGLEPDATIEDVEDRLAATLRGPLLITRVVANRMHITWREGLILNIVTQRTPQTPAAEMLGRIARAALSTLTRREAEHWADKAVRVNAIVPGEALACDPDSFEPGLKSEPEIAALAVRLASNRGKALAGLVFEAPGHG